MPRINHLDNEEPAGFEKFKRKDQQPKKLNKQKGWERSSKLPDDKAKTRKDSSDDGD